VLSLPFAMVFMMVFSHNFLSALSNRYTIIKDIARSVPIEKLITMRVYKGFIFAYFHFYA